MSHYFAPMEAPPSAKKEMCAAWSERGDCKRRSGSVGDVAAESAKENGCARMRHRRRTQAAGPQTLCIPDQVPEHTQLTTPMAQSAMVDIRSWQEKDWDFVSEPPHPTGMVTANSSCGTLGEPWPLSQAGSVLSVASSDMYGWEESLSRRTSNELHVSPTEMSTAQEHIESLARPELPLSPKQIPKHISRTRNFLHKVLHHSSSFPPTASP